MGKRITTEPHGCVTALLLLINPGTLDHANHLVGVVIPKEWSGVVHPAEISSTTFVAQHLIPEIPLHRILGAKREGVGEVVLAISSTLKQHRFIAAQGFSFGCTLWKFAGWFSHVRRQQGLRNYPKLTKPRRINITLDQFASAATFKEHAVGALHTLSGKDVFFRFHVMRAIVANGLVKLTQLINDFLKRLVHQRLTGTHLIVEIPLVYSSWVHARNLSL